MNVNIDNIKQFVEPYSTFDKPIPYKGLVLHPIKVKDYFDFMNAHGLLVNNKDSIPNVRIIQMSFLEYVYHLVLLNEEYKNYFITILELCFGVYYREDIRFKDFKERELVYEEVEDRVVTHINGYDIRFDYGKKTIMYINNVEIKSNDFEKICKIILYQNILEYDDREISPDVQKIIDIQNKKQLSKINPPNIEKQISFLANTTGYKLEYIYDMTYNKFQLIMIFIQKVTN